MKKIILNFCILLGCCFFLPHCKSLKRSGVRIFLKKAKDKKDNSVEFWSPPSPYQRQKHDILDVLWWNPKTKSSLSYFSNCSKHQLSLKQIEAETLSDIYKYERIKTQKTKNSILSEIKIYHLDGHITFSGIKTLKKRNCFYIINFITQSKKSFKKEFPVFKKFMERFYP
ncbi:MAG: hypothetical protein ACR2M7_05875 [Bdellovibrionales bacterium]